MINFYFTVTVLTAAIFVLKVLLLGKTGYFRVRQNGIQKTISRFARRFRFKP